MIFGRTPLRNEMSDSNKKFYKETLLVYIVYKWITNTYELIHGYNYIKVMVHHFRKIRGCLDCHWF